MDQHDTVPLIPDKIAEYLPTKFSISSKFFICMVHARRVETLKTHNKYGYKKCLWLHLLLISQLVVTVQYIESEFEKGIPILK